MTKEQIYIIIIGYFATYSKKFLSIFMKILVTGAAGFIGCFTCQKLASAGHSVVGVDNFNDYYSPVLKRDRVTSLLSEFDVSIHQVDISNKEELFKVFEQEGFDRVCHLAAQAGVRYSIENPDIYISANIIGTHNVFEAARTYSVQHVVFASTSSVYGTNEKFPFSESDKTDNPISLYGATKKSNELEAFAYHRLFNINMFGLRFFTVYGPWGRPDMACFKFTDAIAHDKPIAVYNNGNMKRDFTYIDDITDGILTAIEKCNGFEIINLGNSNPVELEYFISLIEKEIGKLAQKEYMPMQPGDFLQNFADISKARKLLQFNPKTNIEQGVKLFIDWYKEYYKL